jgi:hypothetical protein
MASTITAQNFTATISTQITLNGKPQVTENQLVIEDVNEYDSRIMNLPTASEVTIVQFASAVAAGTFISGDMKYLQITNKDTVNYARIRVKKNGADAFDMRLDAGKSFLMGNVKENVSETAVAFATFEDADSVSGQAYTAEVPIEYVVVSI